MSKRRMRKRRPQAPRERGTFTRLLLIYQNIRKISTVQCAAQAALHTIKTQHTAAPSAANEATPEIIAEHIELLRDVCVLGAVEAVPMHVAHEISGSNDKVERRAAAMPPIEANLSTSSTSLLPRRSYQPRDRSNRLLGPRATAQAQPYAIV
jgi:hypothetical protein